MDIEWLALSVSSSVVMTSVVPILRNFLTRRRKVTVKLQHGDEMIEVNLENPEQAELFIKDFLSRHSVDKGGSAE